MRILFWYFEKFAWNPTIKNLEDSPEASPDELQNVVVAFIHVEPKDIDKGGAETKLVKNAKWLARKWEVSDICNRQFNPIFTAFTISGMMSFKKKEATSWSIYPELKRKTESVIVGKNESNTGGRVD